MSSCCSCQVFAPNLWLPCRDLHTLYSTSTYGCMHPFPMLLRCVFHSDHRGWWPAVQVERPRQSRRVSRRPQHRQGVPVPLLGSRFFRRPRFAELWLGRHEVVLRGGRRRRYGTLLISCLHPSLTTIATFCIAVLRHFATPARRISQ